MRETTRVIGRPRRPSSEADVCGRSAAAASLANGIAAWRSGCASLAAEVTVLPERLQTLTRRFFDIQLQWLQTAIASAIARGECTLDAQRIGVEPEHLMALIDGVALVARGTGTAYALDSEIVNRLLGISANR